MTHTQQEVQGTPNSRLMVICPAGHSIEAVCWLDAQNGLLKVYPRCRLCSHVFVCEKRRTQPVIFRLNRLGYEAKSAQACRVVDNASQEVPAADIRHRWRWKIFLRRGSRFYGVWFEQQFCPGTITIAKHERFGIHVYTDFFSAMARAQGIGTYDSVVVYPVYIPLNAIRMESQSYDPSVEAWDRIQVPTIEEVRKMFPMGLLGWNQEGESKNEPSPIR